jgi:hypothetical protein
MSAYRVHLRPWLVAARAVPRRSILRYSSPAELAMTTSSPSRARWPRRIVALAGVNALVFGGGLAYASWSTSGTGNGSAHAGSAVALTTVTATAASTGLLYPNGPAGDLRVTIKNANPFAVTVTALSGNGTVTATGGTGTCTVTGVSVTPQTGLSLSIPAKSGGVDGSLTTTLSGVLAMDNTSQTGCQGATFTVPVTFTGASS